MQDGTSVYSICSGKENGKKLEELREKIIQSYAVEIVKAKSEEIIPLTIHQDFNVQLYREKSLMNYYILFNLHGVVFNHKSVKIVYNLE